MGRHDNADGTAKAGRAKRGPGRPPIEGPTTRQREILDFVCDIVHAGGRPPSIDEIRRHLKFRSTFAVRTHLQALEKKGLLRIARNSHRGISLPDDGKNTRAAPRLVPLLGDAPAGSPTEAIEQTDEHIALDPAMFPQPDIFAIRVRGDSMVDAGIHDRDIALIRPGQEAADGALVLARLNGEVTLKRLLFKEGRPCLHPENATYSDIPVKEGDSLSIIGTVAGIVRAY